MRKKIKQLQATCKLENFTGELEVIVLLPESWRQVVEDGDVIPVISFKAISRPPTIANLIGEEIKEECTK